ncbi:MAG: Mrp/NBP35 family ATP-binding protein [Lachnospiraceae bacterium]|nr:Mrp/NBP35 family ATP-binding protein [Lachnospiraceae bacterium]
MSENCNNNCSTCKSDCADRKPDPKSFLLEPHELTHVNKIIGVVSGKGGVGKSLVTSMMAVAMSRKGYRVGIMDADVTGPSIPKVFGVNQKAMGGEDGLMPAVTRTGIKMMSVNLLLENDGDPVIWRGPVIAGLVKQFWTDVVWGDLDYLFVDMPPGTGDVPLTVFQSMPLDGILIVTSPQDLVSMIVEKAVRMAEKMNIPVLGIIENMSYFQCPDCGKRHAIFGEGNTDAIAREHKVAKVAKLPVDPAVAQLFDRGAAEDISTEFLSELSDILD